MSGGWVGGAARENESSGAIIKDSGIEVGIHCSHLKA